MVNPYQPPHNVDDDNQSRRRDAIVLWIGERFFPDPFTAAVTAVMAIGLVGVALTWLLLELGLVD